MVCVEEVETGGRVEGDEGGWDADGSKSGVHNGSSLMRARGMRDNPSKGILNRMALKGRGLINNTY